MRIRRAVGAAALALTAIATLSACTDDPRDKAFGGTGDAPAPPTMPSLDPSLRPTGLPDAPGTSAGTSSGTLSGGSSGSSGLTSGGTSGSESSPTGRPTYNSDATSEVIGQNCRYERSTGRMSYDVAIQNASNDYAFRYTFTVVFKVGRYPNSTVASKTIDSRLDNVTVNAGGDRTVQAETSYTTNDRLVYSCQVTSARKSPAS